MIGSLVARFITPYLLELAIGAVALALAAGAYTLWHHHVYRQGYDAAIAAIAAQDQEAIHAADQIRLGVRNCVNGGGVWDAEGGQCRRR